MAEYQRCVSPFHKRLLVGVSSDKEQGQEGYVRMPMHVVRPIEHSWSQSAEAPSHSHTDPSTHHRQSDAQIFQSSTSNDVEPCVQSEDDDDESEASED